MLQEQSRLFQRIFLFADLALVAVAFGLAFVLRFDVLPWLHAHGIGPAWFVPPEAVELVKYLWLLPWAMLGGSLVFYLSGLYASERGLHLFRIVWSALKASAMVLLLAATLLSFYRSFNISRGFLLLFGLLVPLLLILARAMLYGWMRRQRTERRVLLVGSGRVGERIAQTLAHYVWARMEIVAVLDDVPRSTHLPVDGPIDETLARLDAAEAAGRPIHDVYLALPLGAAPRIEALMEGLSSRTARVYYVPDLPDLGVLNARATDLDGLPVLHLIDEVPRRLTWALKRVFDVVFSAAVLVLLSPLLLVIAVGVKLSSPGPIFYRQERVTLGGQRFGMLKFRSMPVNAEAETGAVWAKPGEQRATPLGSFLRRTSLDELPQFWNVFIGQMSVVGPRPERPVFVDEFRQRVPGYMLKHTVPAGITGWAQVHGWRGDTSLEKRIEYDLYYIQNWSLKLDFKIVLLTVFKGFVHQNAY
ncbi:MAG: undecaprenyl-phosphate glucose phosphotransferase [Bacteroidetes bacterium]|nr:undecaprenyl-phosphate glucose phosphotransferase [Bacteroidota bacterium]